MFIEKRKRTVAGVSKEDLPIQSTANNDNDTVAASSPAKKNFSKINRNCPYMESEMSKVHRGNMKKKTWIRNNFTNQYSAMP